MRRERCAFVVLESVEKASSDAFLDILGWVVWGHAKSRASTTAWRRMTQAFNLNRCSTVYTGSRGLSFGTALTYMGPGGRPRALVMARGIEGEFVEIDNLISTAVVYMTAAAGTNENYLEMGTPQRGPMPGVDAPGADQPRGSTFRFSTRCLR